MDGQTDSAKKRQFVWGALLAWIPFLFFLLPALASIVGAFRQIPLQKATGIGAVAGGFAELLATFGLAAALIVEMAAIVLLLRAFSKEHPMRGLISVLSIGCSGLIIAVLVLFAWFSFFRLPHS